jgi:hypothetical protein
MNYFKLIQILSLQIYIGGFNLVLVLTVVLGEHKVVHLLLNHSFWRLWGMPAPLLVYKFHLQVLFKLNLIVILDLAQLWRGV